jgi:hypothetical protein
MIRSTDVIKSDLFYDPAGFSRVTSRTNNKIFKFLCDVYKVDTLLRACIIVKRLSSLNSIRMQQIISLKVSIKSNTVC